MNADTAILVIKALDGLSARSVVSAQNIANANTPGYRPLRVNFEQALVAADLGGNSTVLDSFPQVEAIPIGARDGELRLDKELATASVTAQRYGALIDVLNYQLRLQNSAIAGTVGGN